MTGTVAAIRAALARHLLDRIGHLVLLGRTLLEVARSPASRASGLLPLIVAEVAWLSLASPLCLPKWAPF
jgi:hypothetical protein